jgi:hypothetical protein
MAGGERRASMLMKDLCSYAWVRETYGDCLPDTPWIAMPRSLPTLDQRATGT